MDSLVAKETPTIVYVQLSCFRLFMFIAQTRMFVSIVHYLNHFRVLSLGNDAFASSDEL
jgi:hypothetical protein